MNQRRRPQANAVVPDAAAHAAAHAIDVGSYIAVEATVAVLDKAEPPLPAIDVADPLDAAGDGAFQTGGGLGGEFATGQPVVDASWFDGAGDWVGSMTASAGETIGALVEGAGDAAGAVASATVETVGEVIGGLLG